jgi:protocatechuate 3,4-dioxygenase beta subunit
MRKRGVIGMGSAAALVALGGFVAHRFMRSDEDSQGRSGPRAGERLRHGGLRPAAGAEGVSIPGAVLGPDGRGVSGATVLIARPSTDGSPYAPEERLIADDRGQFRSGVLPFGAFEVVAIAPRFESASERVELGPRLEPLVLRLRPAGSGVSGRVLDVNGGPIAGALVWREPTGYPGDQRVWPLAVSAADGWYAATLPAGAHRLRFESAGYAARAIEARAGQTELDVFLTPGGRIEGTLVARQSGQPIAGATVFARVERTSVARALATTDEGGRFSLSPLAPGRYELIARVEDLMSSLGKPVELNPLGRAEVQLIADRSSAIRGRVATISGRPVAGALVCLGVEAWACDLAVESTRSGGDGTFRLRQGLPEHGWVLVVREATVRGSDNLRGSRRIRVLAGRGVSGADVELPDTGRLEIEVSAAGKPAEGAEVHVFSQPPSPTARVPAEGRLVLEDVPRGTWRVLARLALDEAEGKVSVTGAGAAHLELALSPQPGTRVYGQVRSPGGQPLPGAAIHIFCFGIGFQHVRADVGGGYTFAGCKPGMFALRASLRSISTDVWHRSYLDNQRGTLEPGETERRVDLQVVPTDARISGRVTGPDGRPVVDALVSVRSATERRVATTDPDGHFAVEELELLEHGLQVHAPGLVEWSTRVAAQRESSLTIQLRRGGRLSVRLVDARGLPLPFVRVLARGNRGGSVEGHTASDGTLRLDGLTSDTYRVFVRPEGTFDELWTSGVEVREGEEANVALGPPAGQAKPDG